MLHRLNREEYANAIRDLLHVDVDSRALLPADDTGFGFDNIGDVLTFSPVLMDRYLISARRVVRLALGDPSVRPGVEIYRTPPLAWQDERMSEDLPLGSRGGLAVQHTFPATGEYLLKLEPTKNNFSSMIRGGDWFNEMDLRIDGERVHLFRWGGETATKEVRAEYGDLDVPTFEVRVPVKAGPHTIAVSFNRLNWAYEGPGPERMPIASTSFGQSNLTTVGSGKSLMALEALQITGPFDARPPQAPTPGRERVFVCTPAAAADEEPCAERVLSTFARRAYRRPLTPGDVASLMSFYRSGRASGGFEDGIRLGLQRVLIAPDFLFRVERSPDGAAPGTVHRVSDLELAARLSFFLWSSIPDDELLSLAERGRLRDGQVLAQQVRRMLADRRSDALLSNFFGQWLTLRKIRSLLPDATAFPDFDGNLREAFERETELFIESQVREDRSVVDLLTADYTFLNERLARHYGIPNVYGTRFRRVTYPDDRRAGLFGHASILTVTSYANRTSPVLRGKFLLENVLGTPPPPPPPDVPAFPENEERVIPKSVRERMEQHRKNPVCAACHNHLDALGFALDNFDAVGAWRTRDGASAVDASGAFPNGTTFDGPGSFRQGLLAHRDQFVGVVVERLLTYALGRGAETYDMPAIRGIIRNAQPDGYRWSSIVLEIVKSLPFQMRRSES
ncbi:MAG: DUF1592 domain-containing protein [Acidimicrobiia bacterium]|nr:DUF1592 domain-containing protein [Acidimicrobiia bacterium]